LSSPSHPQFAGVSGVYLARVATLQHSAYADAYVQALFDRMGSTYDLVNHLSSFGFSTFWRRQCIRGVDIRPGDAVCDLMSGSGECWSHVPAHRASLTSIDFSTAMIQRQERRARRVRPPVDIRAENALRTSLPPASVDCVVSAFGLKTLNAETVAGFAREIHRILKPGGRFSLLEISTAEGWRLAPLYRWYVRSIIPLIGRLCLGDIECYRMLGAYTEAFGSCHRVAAAFARAGLEVSVRSHFFGCATSLVGAKPGAVS
jgi:demethylmenaquinone methyltransferase/2-methoxy-6-polyprenyl-1,4-benzoquinol methylase